MSRIVGTGKHCEGLGMPKYHETKTGVDSWVIFNTLVGCIIWFAFDTAFFQEGTLLFVR